MNKIVDIVRLVMTSGLSDQEIATSLQVAKNTVRRYRKIAAERHYQWQELAALTPDKLDQVFNQRLRSFTHKRLPDFAWVHQELQRKGVTLLLLWEEYRAPSPDDALSYSQFTHHYREFARTVTYSMRQIHYPGERAFVDFSGKRPEYVNQQTGECTKAELFVGVLGYSHYLYAAALSSQSLPDWIRVHADMFEYFGGVPKVIVPDNLRSAVTRSGREAILNRTYADLARHYNTAILPARPYHPRDKGKVEVAVQVAQRWILACLRHRTFFSLVELNAAIRELLGELNNRPFRRLPGCRRERFEQEKQHLLPLPVERYEFSEWSRLQRVSSDYHAWIDDHAYSVPYRLIGQAIEARVTHNTVELFHKQQRVATHVRSNERGGHTTNSEHMPDAHRSYSERTPERYLTWAERIGPNLLQIVKHQFDRKLPMLGFPACDSLRKLAKQYGPEKLEVAATRAIEIKSPTVKSVKSLLSSGRYAGEHASEPIQGSLPLHQNLRGANYYNESGDASC